MFKSGILRSVSSRSRYARIRARASLSVPGQPPSTGRPLAKYVELPHLGPECPDFERRAAQQRVAIHVAPRVLRQAHDHRRELPRTRAMPDSSCPAGFLLLGNRTRQSASVFDVGVVQKSDGGADLFHDPLGGRSTGDRVFGEAVGDAEALVQIGCAGLERGWSGFLLGPALDPERRVQRFQQTLQHVALIRDTFVHHPTTLAGSDAPFQRRHDSRCPSVGNARVRDGTTFSSPSCARTRNPAGVCPCYFAPASWPRLFGSCSFVWTSAICRPWLLRSRSAPARVIAVGRLRRSMGFLATLRQIFRWRACRGSPCNRRPAPEPRRLTRALTPNAFPIQIVGSFSSPPPLASSLAVCKRPCATTRRYERRAICST